MKEKGDLKLARGLGSNMGDDKWTEEQIKLQRKHNFAERLR